MLGRAWIVCIPVGCRLMSFKAAHGALSVQTMDVSVGLPVAPDPLGDEEDLKLPRENVPRKMPKRHAQCF